MDDALDIKSYQDQNGGLVGAVRLTENNFKSVQSLLGGGIWHSGNVYEFSVGLTFGEYEDKKYMPFGWWIVMTGGEADYLADVAFTNEYTAV